MKENGKITYQTDLESLGHQLDLSIKEISRMATDKDWDCLFRVVEFLMKVNG